MERSVHDNFLLSYTIDARSAEIVLRTAYLDGEANERTDVIFSGVVAYDFRGDNFQTIIFDISRFELGLLQKHDRERFERLRQLGWPGLNFGSAQEMIEAMREAGVGCFEIHSSFGLDGWVWARSMELRAAGENGPRIETETARMKTDLPG